MPRQILKIMPATLALFLLAAAARGQEPLQLDEIIRRAKEKVFPAVVFIKPVRESFEVGDRRKQLIYGSGVIISSDGLVVTNHHVVDKAIEIRCVLSDKLQFPAKVVGSDKETDLALIRLDLPPNTTTPHASFGDSDAIEEGSYVMAMGAPFGFSRSVSLGIVSNATRYLEASPYNLWIQTDAAINPGNSGGPLVDVRGEIVGINARGVMAGENLGFAIPSARVREVIEEIVKKGRVERAWTGLSLQALRDFSRDVIIDRDEGVLVASVDRNSPASDAGLRIGDRIVAVDGAPVQGVYVEDLPAVERQLAALPAGKPASFRIERGGAMLDVALTPDSKGRVEGGDLELSEWDLTLKEINRYANRFQAYFVGKGVFVQGSKPRGNARRSGLRPGDIVLEIGGVPVRSLDDARAAYAKFNALPKGQRKVLCAILRDGYRISIALDFNRESAERAAPKRERF